MKKIILSFALFMQTVFVFAADNKNLIADKKTMIVNARYENVKMYLQPSTSTEILKSLSSTEEIVVVRKFNHNWSIVMAGDQAGYVLTSELGQPKAVKQIAMARPVRK